MPETNDVSELQTLRQTVAELTTKNTTRKARIVELESSVASLTSDLTASRTEYKALTVDAPLRQMAESLSPVPDIWLSEFNRHFKVELRDGKLGVLTVQGEPAKDKDGKPVEFTRDSIVKTLTKSDNAAFKSFDHITRSSLASGGGASGVGGAGQVYSETSNPAVAAKTKPQFGLR